MSEFDIPTGPQLGRARARFGEMATVDELTGATMSTTTPLISASRLYAYATAPASAGDPEIERALAANASLRGAFRALVERSAIFVLPEAMAASTAAFPVRECEGCRIRVEPSRAEPDQAYVIIELTDVEGTHELVVFDKEDRRRSFLLPAAQDGVIQLIEDTGSDLLRLLADPTSRPIVR